MSLGRWRRLLLPLRWPVARVLLPLDRLRLRGAVGPRWSAATVELLLGGVVLLATLGMRPFAPLRHLGTLRLRLRGICACAFGNAFSLVENRTFRTQPATARLASVERWGWPGRLCHTR